MTDKPPVEPWPRWVRYSLITVFAVLVVIGIVTQVSSGINGAVVRIVIAAVLIPALLAPFQLWGLRRRSQRLAPRLAAELTALTNQIEQERGTEPSRRSAGATDASLSRGAETVARARRLLGAGAEPEAVALVEELGSTTGASWSGELARQQRTCLKTARTLEKVSRRAQSAGR